MKSLFDAFANNQNRFSVSTSLREKRFALFLETLSIKSSDKILDVGGTEYTWINSGFKERVTLLNIRFEKRIPMFSYICADACNMHMIKDNEFDVVFSNSVIEHVGNFERQSQFAKEVIRVGKSHWIQTPYKHFPIEPHFVFPLFQYIPSALQRYIGMKWNYSHLKRNGEDILDELTRLRLLNLSDMIKLFPQSNIMKEKYCGLVKSIIAYK